MKCPLLCICAAVNNKRYPIEAAECLKEECAWWEETQDCAIKDIGRSLSYLSIDSTQELESGKGTLKAYLKSISRSLHGIASKTPLGGVK